jgi:hypothetical protein
VDLIECSLFWPLELPLKSSKIIVMSIEKDYQDRNPGLFFYNLTETEPTSKSTNRSALLHIVVVHHHHTALKCITQVYALLAWGQF